MFNLARNLEKINFKNLEKQIILQYHNAPQSKNDEFKALNLYNVKTNRTIRKPFQRPPLPDPRTNQMPIDQDWGSVWPGPRSFHPASVPLPVRQGYVEKGAPPDKYANAELMKIPNFLHLTPPVIKRQCEALKKFCTPWPKSLKSVEQMEKFFPVEVTSSDYCHSSPTIRDPLARIVTIRFKLKSLKLNERETDKFRRLVGDRYNEANDTVTIVTDRCPLRKQNYDYALYLLTALYHESKKVEPWEELKSEADMEHYIWENNASKQSVEALFGQKVEEIPNIEEYSKAVTYYMNEGENDYTIGKYGEAVKKLLNLPSL
ncbi:28S ribosomal protein S35, mitochondrial [Sitophilus oryzae]|uniref:28S ribosomal protein S35, mitochondrial n=1 Tax=Sitophilus oryzae TaxID=7048 RepID=A0A6J2XIW2_SITOR|nr:28S ribosomal protein S35, mitochondrial [Sitophilus oryzae]XP_030751046.1 28S ribosomal protein S35, mitochondrial [Sitophilus oryzae]